jgi:YVTN family beta-propeller protein
MIGRFRALLLVSVASLTAISCSPVAAVNPSPSPMAQLPTLTPKSTPSASPTASGQVLSATDNIYYSYTQGLSAKVIRYLPRVYVPNEYGASVSVIDPSTFQVVDTLTGVMWPEHVTPDWDMTKLYIDGGDGWLTVIDPTTGKENGSRIFVGNPYNLYFTPDGTTALVVQELLNNIQFYDRKTWQPNGNVHFPFSGVDHLDFSADGSYALVTTEYNGWVFKLDIKKMQIVDQFNVGGLPIDVKLSPDGKLFYISNQGTGGVNIVDPVAMKAVGFIPTGRGAHGLLVSRSGQSMYVTNRLEGTIAVIDFASKTVTKQWAIPGGGSPDMASLDPDGTQLWVPERFSTYVDVFDTTTTKLLAHIKVGSRPHGLCYYPAPGNYSLGHNGVYR